MQIVEVYQKTAIITTVLFFLIEFSSAARTKRQIVFEDERANTVPSANCMTPNREPGYCVILSRCQGLRQIGRYRLRQYLCGFEGNEPKVCCQSILRVFDDEEPTRRPAVIRTTVRPVRTTRRPTTPVIRTTARPVRTTRRPTTPRIIWPDEEPRDRIRPGSGTTQRPRSNTVTKPPFLPRACGVIKPTITRVVGGVEAIKGSWPWMAVIFVRRNSGVLIPDCGGALVTNRHIVTAAHCVVTGRRSTPLDPSRIIVRLGAHNLTNRNEPESIDVEVEEVRRHEQFEPRTYKNDIAVLKLRRPVTFTEAISPVCLPYETLTGPGANGKTAFVVGYGTTAFNGQSSDVLQQASFNIQSQEVCKAAYEPEIQISDVYLCAGELDGSKDACQGDSGGPLVTTNELELAKQFYLVGVVSFGKRCAQPNSPGVYANVTTFRNWLAVNLAN